MKTFLFVFFGFSSLGFAAAYTVPVPSALAKYATFTIPDPQITHSGTTLSMSYQLPPELVGPGFPSLTMTMTEDPVTGGFHLNSENGSADCVRNANGVQCNMQFKNLPINASQAADFITANSSSTQEAQDKMAVFNHFSGDPVGVLSY